MANMPFWHAKFIRGRTESKNTSKIQSTIKKKLELTKSNKEVNLRTMSNISPADGLVEDFETFKSKDKSKGQKRRYIVYRIVTNPGVGEEIQKVSEAAYSGDQAGQFEELKKILLDTSGGQKGAYAVFDCNYETKDGRPTDGVFFIKYVPDTLKVKEKMLYGSSTQQFLGELGGAFKYIWECSSAGELSAVTDIAAFITEKAKK
eukprot:maker-scaffold_6-snap-gene-9.25-mRNA-1 protein AED:0.07 eAED:0.16 QI:0/0/0.33/1/0/0/3/722/203